MTTLVKDVLLLAAVSAPLVALLFLIDTLVPVR